MNTIADRLLATLAKMRADEARHRAEKAFIEQGGEKFQTIGGDGQYSYDYTVTYPYPPLDGIMWTIGEGIILARELEMHLQVMCPLKVGIFGTVMTMGRSRTELNLAVMCHAASRKPRMQDVIANIEAFGLRPVGKQDQAGGWIYEFGNRTIIIHLSGIQTEYGRRSTD